MHFKSKTWEKSGKGLLDSEAGKTRWLVSAKKETKNALPMKCIPKFSKLFSPNGHPILYEYSREPFLTLILKTDVFPEFIPVEISYFQNSGLLL
jgi:hypothetical protein